MQYNKILILGASGHCGRWASQLAVERGCRVTTMVRSLSRNNQPDGVHTVKGDVLNERDLEAVIEGQDAVLSCLGIRRKSPANPWSAITSPTNLTSQSALNIVRAMNKHSVQRLIAISAAGVGESWSSVNPIIRMLVRTSNVKVAFRDLEKMEEIFQAASVDSLAIRPVGLVNDDAPKRAKQVERYGFASQVSRRAVAEWMLDALERPVPFATGSEMIGWG